MMFWLDINCPKCKNNLGTRLFHITGGMGPVLWTCSNCKQTVASGKNEWPRLDGFDRVWYVIVSLIYALFFGIAYTLAIGLTLDTIGLRKTMSAYWPLVLVVSGFAILGVQAARVWFSIARVDRGGEGPVKSGFFAWHSNGVMLAFVPPFVLVATVKGLEWLVSAVR